MFLGLGAVTTLTVPSSMGTANSTPTAVVDLSRHRRSGVRRRTGRRTGIASRGRPAIRASLAPPRLMPFQDVDSVALQALANERVAAVYVIESHYLETGSISAYGRNVSVMGQGPASQRQNAVADAIRASLLKRGLSGNALTRAFAPAARTKALTVDKSGNVTDASDAFSMARFAGTFGVFILFTMAIFFSAGFLQQATIEDRQNRMFEILLSSIDADAPAHRKNHGPRRSWPPAGRPLPAAHHPPGHERAGVVSGADCQVLILVVYFVIGYLLFACLMAGVGMISRTPQEGAQLSAIWTLTASAPMFCMPMLIAAPNGALARTLSLFPLTSPVTMMFRLTMTPDVPILDIVMSMAFGAAAVYVCLRGAAKIFRAATLMYGKRPTLPELVRWLRA